jgi:hypothetical protein
MNEYVIRRADGYCYVINSELSAKDLLESLRGQYIKSGSEVFSTFTPHINRIPVAVYSLVDKHPE